MSILPFYISFYFFSWGVANTCGCDVMKKVAKFDPPSVKHNQRRNQGGWGVAAPLKIGVNSTKLTKSMFISLEEYRTVWKGKEHVRGEKNMVEGQRMLSSSRRVYNVMAQKCIHTFFAPAIHNVTDVCGYPLCNMIVKFTIP